jgi:hypothetical protein
MEPGLLRAMVDVLAVRPEVEAVVPDTKNIDAEGKIIGSMERTLDLQSPDVFERARRVLLSGYQMVIAFGLFRSATLQRLRTRPDYLGWDFVFVWELALHGQIVQPVGSFLLRRWHAGAMSHVRKVAEMKKWVEPKSNASMNFPHWTWTYERWRALIAAPLSARERLRIAGFLSRHTLWQRGSRRRAGSEALARPLGRIHVLKNSRSRLSRRVQRLR